MTRIYPAENHFNFYLIFSFVNRLIRIIFLDSAYKGFPGGSEGKASACNAGDLGSNLVSGRSPGEGNGNPLQYSCLEIPWMEKPGRLQSMGLQRVRHD